MEITKETSLHLLVTAKCNNNCPLCCNKEYNLLEIPVVQVDELAKAGTLCITGGEPLLYFYRVVDLIRDYRYMNGLNVHPKEKNIYIYTSGRSLYPQNYFRLRDKITGFSVGPKSHYDWNTLEYLGCCLKSNEKMRTETKHLNNRLYLFPEWEQTFKDIDREHPGIFENFEVIPRKWQKSFKPAKDSIFRRLPLLFNVDTYDRDENG